MLSEPLRPEHGIERVLGRGDTAGVVRAFRACQRESAVHTGVHFTGTSETTANLHSLALTYLLLTYLPSKSYWGCKNISAKSTSQYFFRVPLQKSKTTRATK
jgi:hypothetical protein